MEWNKGSQQFPFWYRNSKIELTSKQINIAIARLDGTLRVQPTLTFDLPFDYLRELCESEKNSGHAPNRRYGASGFLRTARSIGLRS